MAEFSANTPWGKAQTIENLGQGVMAVTTASHGGIFVPECMLHNIPEARRRDAARWSGSEQWYEEDCCWAYAAEAFPDRFSLENVQHAQSINKARGV